MYRVQPDQMSAHEKTATARRRTVTVSLLNSEKLLSVHLSARLSDRNGNACHGGELHRNSRQPLVLRHIRIQQLQHPSIRIRHNKD